jgi:hypothetical protein
MVGVPLWLGWTRWSALLNGHPAMLFAGILCAFAGVVALAWSVATLLLGARFDEGAGPGEPGHRTPRQVRRRSRWRIVLAVPAVLLSCLVTGLLAYARPYPASPVAVAAMSTSATVRVSDRLTWFELQSTRRNSAGREVRPTTGLVFSPGARVDPRAYAQLLKPLATAGYLVVVLKEPFGLAVLQGDQSATPIRVHPEITRWAVGGHSLGGVTAAAYADAHPAVQGLVLYGSYPARTLTRTDLAVLSVSGTNDALATPADIAEAKPRLPGRTTYVAVRGGIHSYFGDYGEQPGDGSPEVDRKTAQAQIVASTRDLLASLTARRK